MEKNRQEPEQIALNLEDFLLYVEKDEPKLSFRDALKKYREHRQMTVRELAKELNVMPIVVSDVEKGNSEPSLKLLNALKDKMDLSKYQDVIEEAKVFEQKKQAGTIKEQASKVQICYVRKDRER